MRTLTVLLAIVALGGSAVAQEKKAQSLQLKDLPAAVQKGIQDNLKGGEIKNIEKEKENGVEQYEVETTLDGKSRDIELDTKGNLLEVEEASTIDAVPAAAKAALLKKIGGGKLTGVETVTKTGAAAPMYEAEYTDAKGKKHEVLVKADGTEVKE
jgi:hypothetical protein